MDQELSFAFASLFQKIKKLNHGQQLKTRVHPGEFMMLDAIYDFMKDKEKKNNEKQGIKVSELSELIHSTKPATSKMLKALEDKGYIYRSSDESDRRIVYIYLSEDGEKIIYHAKCMLHSFSNRIFQRMGEEDSTEFIRLLNIFYNAMERELNESEKKSQCN